ncbi:MAG TPA: GNAT family protein [Acidimicrobiales bacterium]|jgi:putative acetyltransferase|nr:GNAT family protein [Acidimicrobiales bacterium]
MTGDRTSRIRRATAADVPTLHAIRGAVAGEGRWIGRELPLPEDFADRIAASIADESAVTFVAEVDGQVVGDCGIHGNGAGHGELFMALGPEHRGQGLGGALLAEALAWARARPELHKVVLQVWPHNAAALTLYRRAGFVVEGYRHQHWRRANGELWDVIEMGLLVEG